MAFYYRYKSILYDTGLVKLPYVPVTMIGPNGTAFDTTAVVDSGADSSVISREWGELLGFTIRNEEAVPLIGICGEVMAISQRMNIRFGKDHEVYALEIPVNILIDKPKDGDDDKIPMILGRQGFFDRFDITFMENRERIYFKWVNLESGP